MKYVKISSCLEYFPSLLSLMSDSRFEWISQVSKKVAYEDDAILCHLETKYSSKQVLVGTLVI